jgi:transposase
LDFLGANAMEAWPIALMHRRRRDDLKSMNLFTTLFGQATVDVLTECDVLGAIRLLRTSWDETWHPMQRAVARGQGAKPVGAGAPGRGLGVDGRGQDFITVVADWDAGAVECIADERGQASLDSDAEGFTAEQLVGIEAVAMDMWDPYANWVRARLPNPDNKIVFDRFHLMGYGARPWTPCANRRRCPVAARDRTLARSKYL